MSVVEFFEWGGWLAVLLYGRSCPTSGWSCGASATTAIGARWQE